MDSPCKLPTMKLTATFAILAAFFTTLASEAAGVQVLEARESCNRGGVYCGVSLLNKGKHATIDNQAGSYSCGTNNHCFIPSRQLQGTY